MPRRAAGELDETGFPREGYQLGDLAGAVSLSIPMEVYEAEARERTVANVALFMALAAVNCCGGGGRERGASPSGRQIEAMNEKLEEANGHLASMNDALRQESEYKSTFLATMSTELRTPLASTIALVDVWERDAEGAAMPTERSWATFAAIALGFWLPLTTRLMRRAWRPVATGLSIEPLDMLDVVNAVEQTVRPAGGRERCGVRR